MIKKIILLILVVFLVSCTPEETDNLQQMENLVEEIAVTDDNLNGGGTALEVEGEPVPGECTSEWVCINENFRIYRDENCNLTQKEECKCVEGECIVETCTPGFKCKNTNSKGFQQEDWCELSLEERS